MFGEVYTVPAVTHGGRSIIIQWSFAVHANGALNEVDGTEE